MNPIKNQLVITSDGSSTFFNARSNEHYHSTFGAIAESKHIFIEAGLKPFLGQPSISIFEVGFGTGLNALLALQTAEEKQVSIHYSAIELYPISLEEAKTLNYPEMLKMEASLFLQMHTLSQMSESISQMFYLDRQQISFETVNLNHNQFDVLYFYAFSPEVQPEMWTVTGFQKLFDALKPGGVLVTYSCKGTVKRAIKSVGFQIEKLPGPVGKREFLRAWKP
ncbi:MAG: tRNA (5-methylaminomethyl-2-thiouridine)(34)-methyltransferase MnmD [Bacteroidales bacterium]|jgi:tRNA U34 5-methylaminomethyl-2-thiouridine-forming methyltransferase MnmC